MRAAETAQQQLDRLAEKQRKAEKRAAKAAEKAVHGIENVDGRGRGHG